MVGNIYGIDLGTSTIKIYQKGAGLVLDEKNIIAIEKTQDKKRVIAVGNEAYEMHGKAPANISVTYPVRNGVIADLADMQELLNVFIKKLNEGKRMFSSEFVVAIPCDITDVEKRAFIDLISMSNANAKDIKVVKKPIADGVGAGLEVKSANGYMVVNIGADTTEISVISLGGIVISNLIPIGGNRFDEAIKSYIRKNYNLLIGDKTAEDVKKQLASAFPTDEQSIPVYGRNLVSGLPVKMDVNSSMVFDSIVELLYSIIDSIKYILERTPPEIASDIIDTGIHITGGSAPLLGLDKLIGKETGLKVNVCDDSANTIINGLGKIIEDKNLSSLAISSKNIIFNE
ncbi:MAG: rod shape-determining protein [Clostridiales bacterium]|jgi:rod shape-determining protein MreB|nr:rod shape-determining protein [Clostridiales bacterium]